MEEQRARQEAEARKVAEESAKEVGRDVVMADDGGLSSIIFVLCIKIVCFLEFVWRNKCEVL